jgi:hypothetical protein
MKCSTANIQTGIEIKMALARVLKKHQSLLNLLRNEYEKSTTRNVAKSLHEGGTDKSGIAERRPDASNVKGRVYAGDKQRLVSGRTEQPSGKTVRYGVEGSSKIQNDRGINGKASSEGLVGHSIHETIHKYGALRFIDGSCAETCSRNLSRDYGGTETIA